MERKILLAIVCVLLASTVAHADTATFDMSYIVNNMPDASVDIAYEEEFTDGEKFCQGIIKFKTKQEVEGVYGEGGANDWAWGYYAVVLDTANGIDDCAELALAEDKKPALIYLHWYQPRVDDLHGGRGSLAAARGLARETGGLVLSISSPGQGYNCADGCVGSPAPDCPVECTLIAGDQLSHGESMGPAEIRDGFDVNPLHPEYSMFYGYAHSAMRAVTVIEKQFDSGGSAFTRGYTNGKVVMFGISGGSVTTLIANGVDSRLDGAVGFAGMGGWEEVGAIDGNWLTHLITADLGTPLLTIDCDNSPTGVELEVCEVADVMDPKDYTPLNSILLMDGAQDEFFPVRSYKITRDAYKANAGAGIKVFSWLVPDMDHKWYLWPLVQFNPCPVSFFDWNYIDKIVPELTAFFQKAVNNDLGTFGDDDSSVSITVTGGVLIKTYTTEGMFAASGYIQDARIGYSGTEFLHVFPGMEDEDTVSIDDIPLMSQMGTCDPGHTCWNYSNSYWSWQQPSYYGAYVQVRYKQKSYGGDAMDLEWFLTGDVDSAGTGGYTALTFTPDIRCSEYTDPWDDPPDCTCNGDTPEVTQDFEDTILGN